MTFSRHDFSVSPHSRMTAFSFEQWHLKAVLLSRTMKKIDDVPFLIEVGAQWCHYGVLFLILCFDFALLKDCLEFMLWYVEAKRRLVHV